MTARRAPFAFVMAVGAVAVAAALGVGSGHLSRSGAAYWLAAAVVATGVTVLVIKKVGS